jgi:hypothetical protein
MVVYLANRCKKESAGRQPSAASCLKNSLKLDGGGESSRMVTGRRRDISTSMARMGLEHVIPVLEWRVVVNTSDTPAVKCNLRQPWSKNVG